MKKVVLIILSLVVSLQIKSKGTDSLMIRYSNWDVTYVHISTCSNFETYNGYENEYVVSSTDHVDSLKALLCHLQETDDTYFPVRCKLYIFDTDTIKQKICMNKTYIALGGKTFLNNEKVIKYINFLMSEYSPCNSKRFLPDKMGANYIGGKNGLYSMLYKELDRMASSFDYFGRMVMNIKCKADKKGRTVQVDVGIVKPKKPTKTEKRIARKMAKYIKNNVIWEEDPERSDYDMIMFPLGYIDQNDRDKFLIFREFRGIGDSKM